MKLVIGGCFQGKLDYVLNEYKLTESYISENELPSEALLKKVENQKKRMVLNHFHIWMRNRMLQGGNPEQEIMDFVKQHSDMIVISDEIGNGIVPVDAFEREYRERTGRILVRLAEEADEVVRVICGIGQKIK